MDDGDAYRVVKNRCIGCGLCVSTCPSGALSLVHKPEEERSAPPVTESEWFDERSRSRGVDYSKYR
jgi:ferredoxin